ncbi:MAG: TraC family protein [Candidatus Magasanikbacteria bacterium]|nr:TraC family protein [Candidatus Magasanikbacteria bacterium]
MKNKKAAKQKKKTVPAQLHLLFSEIRNDTIIMKDGTLRAVLMVSSLNFALKNEDEQNAIISTYVSFLNSLEHPLQVVMQSRRLQIKPYLDKLIAKERAQSNELLRAQMSDYRSFVSELVSLGEIMSKQFYVVVPYDPLSNKNKSFWARAMEVINPAITVRLKGERFLKRKYDLDQRLRQIESGLTSMGLTTVRLDTQSLIELLYSTYNPDIALSEQIPPLNKMEVDQS